MEPKYFYRVILTLDDPDPDERVSLAFDFNGQQKAMDFASLAYFACDIVHVKTVIIKNEIDTTNSPIWREKI